MIEKYNTFISPRKKKIAELWVGSKLVYRYKKTYDYLTFTAFQGGSTIGLYKKNSTATLKYSRDKVNWQELNTSDTITLTNVGDKVYFRGRSTDGLSNNYTKFKMTGRIEASGSIMSILVDDPNGVVMPHSYCCYEMFEGCSALMSTPSLPATTLNFYCYGTMFAGCTNLETIPEMPALVYPSECCLWMFSACSNIKISETKVGAYQNEYRIPKKGIGNPGYMAFDYMFSYTGGSFTGTPLANRTYYTSNRIV